MSTAEDQGLEFVQHLHDILLNDWDPLKIRKKADMSDEYDSHIENILDIFEDETATQTHIFDYLNYAETELLQVKPNPKATALASEKIWAAFQAFIA
jgi:hypothetical protein